MALSITKPTVTPTATSTFGTASDDYLLGAVGDDTIIGGLGGAVDGSNTTITYAADGNDTMEGGLGDDWYIVNDTTDVITEYAGEGTDTVFTRVSYTLLGELENIAASGTAAVALTGNTKDNVLDGSQQTVGVDTLIGGAGNDTYILSANDIVNADISGTDTVIAGFTVDISSAAASTNFAASSATVIENVTLSGATVGNITGNASNNRLTGSTGTNTLTGLAGNDILDTGEGGTDILVGGDGNDTYIIRSTATATITDTSGTDTVKSFVAVTAATGIENVTLLGSTAVNATGNTLNNVLIGNGAINTISGDSGNDTLNGGGGADILQGGTGNDIYQADAADTVTESLPTDGTDSVQLGGTDTTTVFTLGDNVENLTMLGALALKASASASSTNHSMTGNSAINALTGGSGNDTLNGGAGADNLTGGAGNDLYLVDNDTDAITDASGTDSVQITPATGETTFSGFSGVENITLTGSTTGISVTATGTTKNVLTGNGVANTLDAGAGDDSLLGNAGNDNMTGGAGKDTLNGGTGDDTMVGSAGADTYIVDSALDIVTETTVSTAASELDTVQAGFASGTFTLDTNVENITLTGATSISATGNASKNIMIGNTGNNTLTGLDGNDTITGLSGTDTIAGGDGADVITGGTGKDSVTAGLGSDKIVFATGVTDTVATATSIAGVDLYSDLALTTDTGDLIDLTVSVSTVATTIVLGALSEATFVANMNTILNVGGGAGFDTDTTGDIAAVIVSAATGDLGTAGRDFLAVDLDKSGTFTATDFVIEITGSTFDTISIDTFV